jgi:hypothetical protein
MGAHDDERRRLEKSTKPTGITGNREQSSQSEAIEIEEAGAAMDRGNRISIEVKG